MSIENAIRAFPASAATAVAIDSMREPGSYFDVSAMSDIPQPTAPARTPERDQPFIMATELVARDRKLQVEVLAGLDFQPTAAVVYCDYPGQDGPLGDVLSYKAQVKNHTLATRSDPDKKDTSEDVPVEGEVINIEPGMAIELDVSPDKKGLRTVFVHCGDETEAMARTEELAANPHVHTILVLANTGTPQGLAEIMKRVPHHKDVDGLRAITATRWERFTGFFARTLKREQRNFQITPEAMVRLYEHDAGKRVTEADPSRLAIFGLGAIGQGVKRLLKSKGVKIPHEHILDSKEKVLGYAKYLGNIELEGVFATSRGAWFVDAAKLRAPEGKKLRIMDVGCSPIANPQPDDPEMGGNVDPTTVGGDKSVSSFTQGVGWETASIHAERTIIAAIEQEEKRARDAQSGRVAPRLGRFTVATAGAAPNPPVKDRAKELIHA